MEKGNIFHSFISSGKEEIIMESRFLPSLPLTRVNASVIAIIMMFCIYIAPFILLRSSKRFTNIISLNPLRHPCEASNQREIIPEVQGSFKQDRGGMGSPQSWSPVHSPMGLETEHWSVKCQMEPPVRNSVS